MTKEQKILALDAAILACRGVDEGEEVVVSPKFQEALDVVMSEVNAFVEKNSSSDFDQYLKDQKEAVIALSESGVVFGGM